MRASLLLSLSLLPGEYFSHFDNRVKVQLAHLASSRAEAGQDRTGREKEA